MQTYSLGFDPATLRERVDLDAARNRLDELGEERSLSALSEKVGLLRVLGRLDEAMDVANEAVRQARFGGDRERLVQTRIERALVQQFSGKLEPALAELGECSTEANAHGWSATEAYALQHRGEVAFELDRLDDAARDLNDALIIRIRDHSSADEVDCTMLALGVILALSDSRSG